MSRGQSTEHLRDYKNTDPDAKKYGYYDPTRMGLNFEVTRGGVVTPVNKGYPIDKRIKDNMERRGIEMPKPIRMKDGTQKERLSVANIILGGSRDRMLQLAFGDQKVDLTKGADNRHITRQHDIEEWARDQYNLMCKLYGEENIVAFIVHLDEKNPHVHCTVIPEKDGKISYNSVIGGKTKNDAREKFKQTHDAVAAVNAKWGLERGDNIQQTGAKHRTSEEYLLWLRDECNKMEKEKGELQGKVTGLKDSVKLLENEIRRNEIKVKGLTTMVTNKMTVINDLETQRQDLENEVMTGEYNLQEVQNKKNNLDMLLQNNLDILERRRRELEETKKLLELLKKQHAEKLQQVRETDEKLSSLRREMNTLNVEKMDRLETDIYSDIGYFFLEGLKKVFWKNSDEIRSKLSLEDRNIFDRWLDNMFIPEFAENGDDIIKTAAALFLGREGDAIEIATSAGGGGSPGSGWRKKKDEDDEAYRFRCLGMACLMMRPKSRRIRR